ncbi:SDR family NAD(P)-dependent oxidoreductase [Anaerovibrio slackiae]|uniref:SDR family NAD(P)-dependent oxidoreductase n=1 Tax=Anaerovibrio slackiae TaxID=2652309 RepID=UPI003869A7BC
MLNGKVAIITGGTSGIGAGTAEKLAAEGAVVALFGRNAERGNEIANKINSIFGMNKCEFFKCDVSSQAEVKNTVELVGNKFSHIDILFNNAGVMLPSMEIERMPVDDWKTTLDINITGMFLVTRYVKPYLLKSRGVIINNASIAGLQYYAAGRSYAYSASKAAVIQFSHQMAKNYGEEGIRVNCICPGIIDTPILGDRDRKIYAERIPLGYVGQPSDVANVVAFLVSEAASYITGAVLPIDGGASI